MSRIRSRDTSPEMTVRRLVHGMGFRYRLHVSNLPGKPDLVFPRLHCIIDVRGCFWHQHAGCIDSHIPKSREDYWRAKLQYNESRDAKNIAELQNLGWRVLVIWECEAKPTKALVTRLKRFLSG